MYRVIFRRTVTYAAKSCPLTKHMTQRSKKTTEKYRKILGISRRDRRRVTGSEVIRKFSISNEVKMEIGWTYRKHTRQ